MTDRNKDFIEFRNTYKRFTYNDYKYEIKENCIEIEYNFEINNLETFNPKWKINIINKKEQVDNYKIENLVFSLGMVELISYWKLTCSPVIEIKCMNLSEEQIKWWKKLYRKGLGEFYYLNSINPEKDYMEIICNSDRKLNIPFIEERNENCILVPVGGGKDSIVTLELLKDKFNSYPFIINPRGATTNTVLKAELENKLIEAKRTLDKKILRLNENGFLNGHTPFSAMVAFSTILTAYLNNLGYVCLSNESSANESTVKGTEVNHQYSKSFEFEEDFKYYHDNFIKSPVKYFSFLRPLSEMQIAKAVSNYKKYHDIFRSCNVGSKEDKWCASCSKCLFVYIMLAPYLSKNELFKIFGKDMFEDEKLLEDFKKLTGILEEKPFECVGEIEEVKASLNKTLDKYTESLPYLLKYFKENFKNEKFKDFSNYYNEVNNLPKKFADILKSSEDIYEK